MAKKKKKPASRKLSVYSNLSRRRKTKKDSSSRQRAEYLASLPKHPVKRFFYRLHPKRFWGYWFSKRGALMALKIVGIGVLLLALFIGGLFAYFRKDLDQIRPGELAKRVQSTVTKYYDRNDKLLWEDKGDGNYKLVVESDEISDLLKQATIAIEDRNFLSHGGVSISGTMRAFINNLFGGVVQGGSTLTQQLVKQVFFADEASDRGWGGVPRKIKELILAIEVERMYDKDQILTLYLNESPYGGRRNGVESGAQTYFGKSAKDVNLAEAALLAAIPQNPAVYDPYNVAGHEGLINRQHLVLNAMKEVGFITQEQLDEAKEYPILDSIKPQSSQYEGIKAPHFVQMVRSQLEQELGKATVGRGGLTVKTTLDLRIQEKLIEAMNDMFKSYVPEWSGFSNGAATVADSKTGQIVALVGSRDFNYPGFGQDNAATASIQPGSTVKPFVYSQLFEQKPSGQQNYGSGTILKDERIDSIYGSRLNNWDGRFMGNISIRTGLATSRNIPAVKAMYINDSVSGAGTTINTIHELGAESYCTQGVEVQVNLAAAIGGCGVKQVDLVNAYTSLARGGVYKPQSTVLEVKNNSGETLKKWSDTTGQRIVSEQSAYIVSDILSDPVARASLSNTPGMNIPNVKTATKTGTSDIGGYARDLWMASYSPALTMVLWLGNPDMTILKYGYSSLGSPIIEKVMRYAHLNVYAKEGNYTANEWYKEPSGIQHVGRELYPSWWNKTQGQANAKLTFDRVSKRKANSCTPEDAKIEFEVIKTVDPVTKKEGYINLPGGYDAEKEDNVHCNAPQPSTDIDVNGPNGSGEYVVSVATILGSKFTSFQSGTLTFSDGTSVSINSTSFTYDYKPKSGASGDITVTAKILDNGYQSATDTATISL